MTQTRDEQPATKAHREYVEAVVAEYALPPQAVLLWEKAFHEGHLSGLRDAANLERDLIETARAGDVARQVRLGQMPLSEPSRKGWG
jgi:hypothetical protein